MPGLSCLERKIEELIASNHRPTPVEAIIYASLDDIKSLGGADKRDSGKGTGNREILRSKVDVIVFKLGRPIGKKAPLDTAAHDPSRAI
jgi:hypothetical protein